MRTKEEEKENKMENSYNQSSQHFNELRQNDKSNLLIKIDGLGEG